jgi:hypothetical protein
LFLRHSCLLYTRESKGRERCIRPRPVFIALETS